MNFFNLNMSESTEQSDIEDLYDILSMDEIYLNDTCNEILENLFKTNDNGDFISIYSNEDIIDIVVDECHISLLIFIGKNYPHHFTNNNLYNSLGRDPEKYKYILNLLIEDNRADLYKAYKISINHEKCLGSNGPMEYILNHPKFDYDLYPPMEIFREFCKREIS